MPSLMIDHLSINLRSGTDNLVSEISFAIKEGESLILLGQSGSGKTMTCSAVLNLLDPKKFKVSGSVFFGETDLLNSSEKQRRGIYGNQIVYIPQNPMTALDPSMRIGRQMDETLRLHSDKSRQQRYNYILRLLHDVGLDDPDRVYRAYPHMLSGGMLQRVIIAMAMMLDAKFVLADEPTTALDVIHRNGIIDLFSQMKANGVGILMVAVVVKLPPAMILPPAVIYPVIPAVTVNHIVIIHPAIRVPALLPVLYPFPIFLPPG